MIEIHIDSIPKDSISLYNHEVEGLRTEIKALSLFGVRAMLLAGN